MALTNILSLYKGTNILGSKIMGLKGISTMANSLLDCNCIDCGEDANCINCD
ncbi:MAG: hypothetical protein IJ105_05360 [Bacilli bacterium]|nr:hypothetical protein [Bacilli bacterium]